MRLGIEAAQVPSLAWQSAPDGTNGSHVVRSAATYMLYQLEAGTQCPQTMTFAAAPVFMESQTSRQAETG